MTRSGELYTATIIDKLARDPSINRNLGTAPSLRTEQMNSKWLNGKGRCAGLDGDGGGDFDDDDKLARDL